MKKILKNKKILISGAAGSIGSELCRQVINYKPEKLIALDNNETELYNIYQQLDVIPVLADIRDRKKIEKIFLEYKPDIVYHAAAYKHVTFAYADRAKKEDYPFGYQQSDELIKTNIYGLENMIECCKKYNVKLVFISSDKAVNPTSIMGMTKRIGELICQENGYISVRFGNVLGSRGSVIPAWEKSIQEGKPILVTDKRMKRYFMTIEEACHLVIEASVVGKGGEIFILDMGEPINILDLAHKIVKESRKDIPIKLIGIRSGEKLFEELMTEEEKKKAIKRNKFYIVK